MSDVELNFVKTSSTPEAGVSFRNRMFLIAPHVERGSDDADGAARSLLKAIRASANSGNPKRVRDEVILADYSARDRRVPVNPAACVHDGWLYVFWQEAQRIFFRRSIDGDNWLQTQALPGASIDRDASQIAAVSTGDTLLVFAPSNGRCQVARYAGEKWATETRPDHEWTDIRGIAACAFLKTADPEAVCIMLATVGPRRQVWTSEYAWRKGRLSGHEQRLEHPLLGESDTLALVQGSTEGGARGNIVQLFTGGKDGCRKQEYVVEAGTWTAPALLSEVESIRRARGKLAAFQHFGPEHKGIASQTVWLLYRSRGRSGIQCAHARCYPSDRLSRTGELTQDIGEKYRDLWCLLGVVEGPPPYLLNDQPFSRQVSEVTFEHARGKQTSATVDASMCALVSIGGKGPSGTGRGAVGIAGNASQMLTRTTTRTVKIGHQQFNQRDRDVAVDIYLKPTVQRTDYEVQDYGGTPLGIIVHQFTVTQWAPAHCERDRSQWPRNPTSGRRLLTGELDSWLSRMNDIPRYAHDEPGTSINTVVAWSPNSELRFAFDQTQPALSTGRSSATVSFEAGSAGIFGIGRSFVLTMTTTHSTAIGGTLGFTLRYPGPRPNHGEDIAAVDLRVLLLVPRDDRIDDCYWIPADRGGGKAQRPWCLTWSVDGYQTQGGASFGHPRRRAA